MTDPLDVGDASMWGPSDDQHRRQTTSVQSINIGSHIPCFNSVIADDRFRAGASPSLICLGPMIPLQADDHFSGALLRS
jgi:hypothetical protein